MYLLHKIYQNGVKQAPNNEKNGIFDLIYLKKVCTAILGILKTKGCARVELDEICIHTIHNIRLVFPMDVSIVHKTL